MPTTSVGVSAYGLFGVSVNPMNPSVLYVNGYSGAGRSTDGGGSWEWTAYY